MLSTPHIPTMSAWDSLTSICHSSWMLATNPASTFGLDLILLSKLINALFIAIEPPPCNKVFRAACGERMNNFLPSNALMNPFADALVTLSLSSLSAGRLVRKRSLSSLPSFLFPPTTVPSFLSPAPYMRA